MADAVLDASAVLAFLQREPGQDVVAGVLPHALISAVNLAEVMGKLVEKGASPEAATRVLDSLPFEVVPFDEGLALVTGALWRATRAAGLSLGDRACLALAERERLPAFTTDRDWAKATTSAEIRLVR